MKQFSAPNPSSFTAKTNPAGNRESVSVDTNCQVETNCNLSLRNHPNNNNQQTQPTQFRNKYRIESTRLKNYDYSSEGAYFITICTKNREHYFGEIVDGKMVLNDFGKIAHNEWKNTENIRENITVDEFVVMPNHIHGILFIDYRIEPSTQIYSPVETNCNLSLQLPSQHGTSQTIGSIVRGFKIVITKWARENIVETNGNLSLPPINVWQPNYHDHIIRDENELNRIREYIANNPLNWKNDQNNVSVVDTRQPVETNCNLSLHGNLPLHSGNYNGNI